MGLDENGLLTVDELKLLIRKCVVAEGVTLGKIAVFDATREMDFRKTKTGVEPESSRVYVELHQGLVISKLDFWLKDFGGPTDEARICGRLKEAWSDVVDSTSG